MVIGTARDIIEHCGVARFLFIDFPLGNPCGEPGNIGQQRKIFQQALDLLVEAKRPRTTYKAGFVWSKGDQWKHLIFTQEQPFQDEETKAKWEARNKEYRHLKMIGQV